MCLSNDASANLILTYKFCIFFLNGIPEHVVHLWMLQEKSLRREQRVNVYCYKKYLTSMLCIYYKFISEAVAQTLKAVITCTVYNLIFTIHAILHILYGGLGNSLFAAKKNSITGV